MFHQLSGLSGALAYTALVAAVGVALLVAMTRVHKGGSFLMGCSVVLVTLDLFDKLSFFNEWQLGAGVVLAAGAEALRPLRSSGAKVAGMHRSRALLRGRGMMRRLNAMIRSAWAM